MRRILMSLTGIVLVAFAAFPHCTTAAFQSAGPPPPQAAGSTAAPRHGDLFSLESIALLKESFQRDSGKIRLVALVSPT